MMSINQIDAHIHDVYLKERFGDEIVIIDLHDKRM